MRPSKLTKMNKLQLSLIIILFIALVGTVVCLPDAELKSPVCMPKPSQLIPWERRNDQEGLLDILSLERPKYLENYKNPCWEEEINGVKTLRCLPYFFMAGFTKCGSTDLWYWLKHPNISKDIHKREYHWWSTNRFSESKMTLSMDEYIDKFRGRAREIQQYPISKDGQVFYPKITGDPSPDYIWKNLFWKQIPQNSPEDKEPCVVHAHLIKHLLPNAKILVSLRNPLSHIFSIYNFFGKEEKSPELFHEFCLNQIAVWNECIKNNTWRQCAYRPGFPITDENRFAMTIHVVYMKDWLEVFPRDQIYISQLEEYSQNRAKVLDEIFKFLDLGPVPDLEENIVEAAITNRRTSVGAVMLDKTKDLMTEFYRPYKKALSELLGDDRWMYE